jgi:putative tryptophan/tyrosine transport system substrate-binding protein
MTRRAFGLPIILALGLLLAPLTTGTQPGSKMPRLGILEDSPFWEAFRQQLRDLGYIEGQNITIEYRFAEGRADRLPDLAPERARLPVDVMATFGTPAARAAKHATSTIPIVMVSVGDPLRAGLVASFARPGGNVTGSTILVPELSPKRLQILQEVVPFLARVAFLWNPTNPANVLHFEDIQTAAQTLGVPLQSVAVRSPDEFARAFAAESQLPVMANVKENVAAGALLIIRRKSPGAISAGCPLCGQDSERGHAGRSARAPTH